MLINELPFEIEKKLRCIFDTNDYWKKLAEKMQMEMYINFIEQHAKKLAESPTHHLLKKWSGFMHTVEELCILLHQLENVPALQCLLPLVDSSVKRLVVDLNRKSRHRKKNNENGNQSSKPLHNGMTDEIIRNVAYIPKIRYEELEIATDGWNEANYLGHGGFAQVFKGEWQHSPVAVKRLNKGDDPKNKELINEMILNQYRHDYILPLYGYSNEGPQACLVYQLMTGGSLKQRLRVSARHPPLTWPQRYRVARGVASGLQFLHNMDQNCPLIHGDIKPGNILLDDYLTPKIGDFGLAIKGSSENNANLKISSIFGTAGYVPDDYIVSHTLSPAVDVFSFGVVLLEMATALPVVQDTRAATTLSAYIRSLASKNIDFATLEDPALRGTEESNPRLCRQLIEIGLHCTRHKAIERPTMLEVFKQFNAMNLSGRFS